jgi:general secretion pathway protein G
MRARRKLEGNQLIVRRRGSRELSTGFTLIELMIVITIIFILLGLAAGQYRLSVVRAREAALLDDLHVMREAIDNFTVDKQAAPQSIEDLANAHYLRDVPTDPMTQTKDWQPVFEDVVLSPDQSGTGMTDVHSNSDKVSPFTQTPYNTW